jgi:hypothetical protein
MSELDILNAYRAGQISRQTLLDRFQAAGWDQTDIGLLAENVSYTRESEPADPAERHIRQQERARRRQSNALMGR